MSGEKRSVKDAWAAVESARRELEEAHELKKEAERKLTSANNRVDKARQQYAESKAILDEVLPKVDLGEMDRHKVEEAAKKAVRSYERSPVR